MALKDQLQADLKTAMKNKEKIRKSTITMIRAAVLQVEKDNMVELGDEEILVIIAKQLKQCRDSLVEFEKAQRDDLIQQAHEEIEVIVSYLPAQLTADQIRVIVNETIQETGAVDAKDMGKIMGVLMPKVKGRADGKLVNQVVRESLIS
ncbi:MAG TPA: GatB/YqeY domain-containing protein [Acetobacterium sp.]|uniref:GatB/YqeY domain-containing protein n=1 Tax=Acetobacterium sp. TaxID=1872094 RepID=UPI002F420E18